MKAPPLEMDLLLRIPADRGEIDALHDLSACLALLASAKVMAERVFADPTVPPPARIAAGEWLLALPDVVDNLRTRNR